MIVWAVVLAAGDSRRFGRDKLSTPLGEAPLVESVLTAVTDARETGTLRDGLVVVRSAQSEVARLAAGHELRTVVNRQAARGMGTSLRAGLDSIERADRECQGALVLLADQPLVTAMIISAIVGAAEASRADVVRAQYADAPAIPGHPVFLRRPVWSLAKQLDGDEGLRMLIEASTVVTESVVLPGSNPDIDTPRDLDALREHHPHA